MTVVDFSGDTVTSPRRRSSPIPATSSSTPTEPRAIVINAQGSLNTIPLSNPVGLLTSQVVQTTLPAGSDPVSITSFAPASALLTIFIPQAGTNTIAALNAGTAALYDTVGIQGGATHPVYVVGSTGTPRVYAISQDGPGGNGQVDAIETVSTTSLSDSAQIPVGVNPVYGVMTTDDPPRLHPQQGLRHRHGPQRPQQRAWTPCRQPPSAPVPAPFPCAATLSPEARPAPTTIPSGPISTPSTPSSSSSIRAMASTPAASA